MGKQEFSNQVKRIGVLTSGGNPTARDRVNATRMGHHAVTILAEGKTNRIVVHKQGAISDVDMIEGLQQKNKLSENESIVVKTMTGVY